MTTAHLSPDTKVAVIGLGYVGLPLAVALARHFKTTGLDISARRIEELRQGIDRKEEVEPEKLKASALKVTSSTDDIRGFDIFIITVPQPVDDNNKRSEERRIGKECVRTRRT